VLYNSTGPAYKNVSVPNVVGMTLEQATKALQDKKLSVITTKPEPGEPVPTPIANTTPSPTPTFTPTPSPTMSPEPTPSPTTDVTYDPDGSPQPPTETEEVPTPTPLPIETPISEPTPTPPPVPTALTTVVYQYPAADASVAEGESVTLYFYDVESIGRYYTLCVDKTILDEAHADSVNLRIECWFSDTETSKVAFSDTLTIIDFPESTLNISVPVSYKGYTKINIYTNGSLYREILYDPKS
jgi:hypothetical protein